VSFSAFAFLVNIQLVAVGEHCHFVFSGRKDQIIVFTLRAVLCKCLLMFFSFVISVDVLRRATLRLRVKLQLLILIDSFPKLKGMGFVIATQHVKIINFSIDITRCYFLIIDQFCHVFLINTTCFQNLEIRRLRHLKRIFVLHIGSSIFEHLICFDRSQGCCHKAFNLLIIAGFRFGLICSFLIIDLYLSTRICCGGRRLFQIDLISSTLILSSHSKWSRPTFTPLICNLAQYLIQSLLLTQHLNRLLTSTFASRFLRLAFLINRISSGFGRAFLLRRCCILLHLNCVHFIFTSNLIGTFTLRH